jgi:hypothetical protein
MCTPLTYEVEVSGVNIEWRWRLSPRAACLTVALGLLEEGDQANVSLCAVGRRCRGLANRTIPVLSGQDALFDALATPGYEELHECLVKADGTAAAGDEFVVLAYGGYAVAHPALSPAGV